MGSRARGRVVSVILGMVALALGPFCAAPALASHVRCGDTITTDTTLDSDLLDCPGYGVFVGADDVTLDLNGHTISGTGAGQGIRNQAFDRVVVENGVVTGFQGGVWLLGTIENRLSNLTVTANDFDGIRLLPLGGTVASSGNRIEHSRVHGNGQGIVLIQSNGNRIDENVVAGNDNEEVQLTDSSGNRVETNSVSDSGQSDNARKTGIALSRSHDNRIAQNSVSGNAYGLRLEGSDGNQLQRNLLEDNLISIRLEDSNGNSVHANRVREQEGIGGLGIAVHQSDTNLVTGKTPSPRRVSRWKSSGRRECGREEQNQRRRQWNRGRWLEQPRLAQSGVNHALLRPPSVSRDNGNQSDLGARICRREELRCPGSARHCGSSIRQTT